MRSTPSNLSTIGLGTHDLGWTVGWSASKLLTELDSEHRVSGSGLPTCFPWLEDSLHIKGVLHQHHWKAVCECCACSSPFVPSVRRVCARAKTPTGHGAAAHLYNDSESVCLEHSEQRPPSRSSRSARSTALHV